MYSVTSYAVLGHFHFISFFISRHGTIIDKVFPLNGKLLIGGDSQIITQVLHVILFVIVRYRLCKEMQTWAPVMPIWKVAKSRLWQQFIVSKSRNFTRVSSRPQVLSFFNCRCVFNVSIDWIEVQNTPIFTLLYKLKRLYIVIVTSNMDIDVSKCKRIGEWRENHFDFVSEYLFQWWRCKFGTILTRNRVGAAVWSNLCWYRRKIYQW